MAVPRGLCRVSQGVSRVCVPQLAGLSTVAGVDVDVDAVRLHSRAARRCGAVWLWMWCVGLLFCWCLGFVILWCLGVVIQ